MENICKVCLLDLPNSILECILERLSPSELCKVSTLCTFLREKIRTSEHLWEAILKRKWGRVIGDSALREWHRFVAFRKASSSEAKSRSSNTSETSGTSSFKSDWPIIITIGSSSRNISQWTDDSFPDDSIMDLCISLEIGLFWFPAQLYNERNDWTIQNWHDAMLSYDSRTDTFKARYPLHGWSEVGGNVGWDKVRAPAVDISPFSVYASNSIIHDLKPGDHIEIQWRHSLQYPFDWWYALISHVDTCDGRGSACRCHDNDQLVLEFIEYPIESYWRRAVLSRKVACYKEQGNQRFGFYGGIRKIQTQDEIARWNKEILPISNP
ncbi:hypothetical protein QN277_005981 [Acacia crassicarpa]|uniref:F-box domain-containing protein n=1 Tax=Acacia crassicarpa TaxID=499986 RepID=A0AAE1MEU2_9FABA|nr:hypothetical protein QN277_005981 [Acacia crassicarpa]